MMFKFFLQGYWASYNIPYYPFIFNISGYPAMEKQYGSSFSWNEVCGLFFLPYKQCPRAQIFRRNATDVTNLQSMKSLMRYNNYEHDPLSENDPGNAIASRFVKKVERHFFLRLFQDLSNSGCFGGIDSKVANVQYVAHTSCEAICGPTYDEVAAFTWDNWNGTNWPHAGQPTVWKFPWEIMNSQI